VKISRFTVHMFLKQHVSFFHITQTNNQNTNTWLPPNKYLVQRLFTANCDSHVTSNNQICCPQSCMKLPRDQEKQCFAITGTCTICSSDSEGQLTEKRMQMNCSFFVHSFYKNMLKIRTCHTSVSKYESE
jgi:hypothetical protein